MKKLLSAVAVVMMLFVLSAVFVACNRGEKNPTPDSDYKIDVETLSLPMAELGKTYTIAIPDVVDKKGEKMTGNEYKVSVKSVADPNGGNANVMGGMFLVPNIPGNYKVTYTCAKEGVADAVKAFQCSDSEAPTVGDKMIANFALLNQKVPVPEFTIEDNNDIPEENIDLKILRPDGSEATAEDGWFTADTVGKWTYKIKVTDLGGNTVEKQYDLTVIDEDPVEDKIAYLDEEWGMQQVRPFANRDEDLSYVTNENLPEGSEEFPKPSAEELKGALKVDPAEGVRASILISPTIYDLSGYDYIGFWAYNDSSLVVSLNISFANLNQNTIQPKQWQFMALYCGADQYNEAWNAMQPFDHVVELSLYDDIQQTSFDGALYIGGISGYHYSSDAVFAFDLPEGRMHMNTHVAHRDVSGYSYTTAVKEDGGVGSTHFFAIKNTSSIQARFIKAKNVTADASLVKDYFVKAWVYNPHETKTLKFVTETSESVKITGTVAPKSSAYVPMVIRSDKDNAWMRFDNNPWQMFFLDVYYTDDSNFAAGDGFYIGAVIGDSSPVITVKNTPRFAVAGEPIVIPDCEITLGGEALGEEYISWSALRPDGSSVAITDGVLTPDVAGDWYYVVEAKGETGNSNVQKIALYVSDIEARENVIAYLDDEEGMHQIRSYGKRVTLELVPNAVLPEGAEGYEKPSAEELANAVKIVGTPNNMPTFVISSAINDLSQFDYIGFWFYNAGSKESVINLLQKNNHNQTVSPGQWQYITMDCSMPMWTEIWQDDWMQNPDHVIEFILADDSSKDGGPFYIGTITGGVYGSDSVFAFESSEGGFHFNPHGGHRAAYDYSYVKGAKDENNASAEGSFYIQSAAESTTSFQMRFVKGQNIPENASGEFEAYMWIKNPTDKEITVTCDRPSGTYTTTIAANSEGYAKVCVKWVEASAWATYDNNKWEISFVTVTNTDGSAFAVGTGIYIGAVTLTEPGK